MQGAEQSQTWAWSNVSNVYMALGLQLYETTVNNHKQALFNTRALYYMGHTNILEISTSLKNGQRVTNVPTNLSKLILLYRKTHIQHIRVVVSDPDKWVVVLRVLVDVRVGGNEYTWTFILTIRCNIISLNLISEWIISSCNKAYILKY